MMIWLVLFIVAFLAIIAGVIYMVSRVRKLTFLEKISGGKRTALAALIVLGAFGICYLAIGLVNAALVIIYTLGVWIIVDLCLKIYKKKSGKSPNYNRVVAGILVFILAYFAWGWYGAHNVVATKYTLESSKDVPALHLVQISDSHVGATFDGDGFAREMEKVQKENPDVVVLTGDFVDDDTSKEDMIKSAKALGNLKTKYGVYFVFGNHDKGYSNSSRGYDGAEVVKQLKANGVKVLEDETVLIADKYYLIGRQDKSEEMSGGRASMSQLVKPLDKDKYQIVLDHQPADYDNQKSAGVDLVLSGHTHGGQMIPINYLMGLTGQNDMINGIKTDGKTTFEVSSGISDWAIKFKTGCKSEYVVIDIK